MSLLGLIVSLAILGAVLYLVTLIPMEAWLQRVIQVLAILFVVLWILDALGIVTGIGLRVR